MEPETTVFAVPTYRLRDVAEAIEAYAANFWRNNHVVRSVTIKRTGSLCLGPR